jgi:hypothetical protein
MAGMIDTLDGLLADLPECELRLCARRALSLWEAVDDVRERLRDLDACVFRAFSIEDVPADIVERDYGKALELLDAISALQAALRRALYERFGVRPIVGPVGQPYDERSPRFSAANARPTGNPSLDWHVAGTAALGYEWEGEPAVLRPARVEVYRYDEDEEDADQDADIAPWESDEATATLPPSAPLPGSPPSATVRPAASLPPSATVRPAASLPPSATVSPAASLPPSATVPPAASLSPSAKAAPSTEPLGSPSAAPPPTPSPLPSATHSPAASPSPAREPAAPRPPARADRPAIRLLLPDGTAHVLEGPLEIRIEAGPQ